MGLRGQLYGIGATLRGKVWRAHLTQIETMAAADLHDEALPALLRHALAHVPYYRELEIHAPRIASFPLLSRTALRTQFERLKSDDLASRRWIRTSTGGSTGEPVWVVLDQEFLDWDNAADMYAYQAFCGMSFFEYLSSHRVAIWHRRRRRMSPNPWIRLASRMLNQLVYVEPYEILTEEKLNEHVDRINRHKPAVIMAFSGTVFEIAKHAQRLGLPMHRPRFIVTSVEMLYPAMRNTIEAVFGCPVFDRYGAAETGRIATQCSHGKYHVFTFSQHVEVLDDQDLPARPGEVGRIVVTPLRNLAMPLIRYDIGDLARVSAEPCRCGSPLPTWDEISGRVLHHFVRADGNPVYGGNFIAMFYEYDWVLQIHVLQEDVDRMVISFKRVPGRDVPQRDLQAMEQVIHHVMGESCRVVWNEVDVVPHSAVGKHLHTRSMVWEERVKRAGS